MATRKRTDLRSRDVPVKRELKGKPPFGFRFQLFFCRSYSCRSAAVCPFPTADHPPAPECFFRGRWMISLHSPLFNLFALFHSGRISFSTPALSMQLLQPSGYIVPCIRFPQLSPRSHFPFRKHKPGQLP